MDKMGQRQRTQKMKAKNEPNSNKKIQDSVPKWKQKISVTFYLQRKAQATMRLKLYGNREALNGLFGLI